MPVSYTWPAGLPNPTSDFGYEEEPRVRKAKFGDGYAQTSPDGLNSIERNLTPSWEPLTLAQKDTMIAFFRARKGSEGFFWPLPNEGRTIKVKATRWSIKPKGTKSQWLVNATFEEIFDV